MLKEEKERKNQERNDNTNNNNNGIHKSFFFFLRNNSCLTCIITLVVSLTLYIYIKHQTNNDKNSSALSVVCSIHLHYVHLSKSAKGRLE